MELDREELRALARFIARRMGPEVVHDPLDPPLAADPVEAWTALLEQAYRESRLDALLRRVAAQAPEDHRLQEACRLLMAADRPAQGSPLRVPRVVLAAALVALLGVGALVGTKWVQPAEPEPVRAELVLQPQSVGADTELLAASGYVEPTEALEAAGYVEPTEALAAMGYVEPTEALEAAGYVEPTEALEAAGYVEPTEALEAAGYVEPTEALAAAGYVEPDPAGDCGARPGELVGYWYAGEEPPGSPGEIVVVPHSVNVRADYPDARNQFDARAPVRCVLGAGSQVRLSKEPIPVPRESWWVPLISGDVLPDRTG